MSWLGRLFGKPPEHPPPERVVPIATVQIPPSAEPVKLYQDQVLRKAWSEEVLNAAGIRINPHLPCIEGQAEITLRSSREVADRLLALTIVAVKGEGLEQDHMEAFVTERNVGPLLSPKERTFIDNPEPDDHSRVHFSWRYEAAWPLLWALQYVEGPLGLPREIADVARLVSLVRHTADLTEHGLRPANDILNEADLIYRCHWAVRQASIDGQLPSGGLHPGVTMERHHALNWLIRYCELEWDDVTTDT